MMALAALGVFDAPFHETFHAELGDIRWAWLFALCGAMVVSVGGYRVAVLRRTQVPAWPAIPSARIRSPSGELGGDWAACWAI